MNDTLEIASYIKDGKGVAEEDVDIHFEIEKYAMDKTNETRDMIERIWSVKSKENARLFNQSKYRLASHSWDEDARRMKMMVGLTD